MTDVEQARSRSPWASYLGGLGLCGWLLLGPVAPVPAAAQDAEPAPESAETEDAPLTEEELANRVDELVEQLASDEDAERVRAARALRALPPDALPALRDAARNTSDPRQLYPLMVAIERLEQAARDGERDPERTAPAEPPSDGPPPVDPTRPEGGAPAPDVPDGDPVPFPFPRELRENIPPAMRDQIERLLQSDDLPPELRQLLRDDPEQALRELAESIDETRRDERGLGPALLDRLREMAEDQFEQNGETPGAPAPEDGEGGTGPLGDALPSLNELLRRLFESGDPTQPRETPDRAEPPVESEPREGERRPEVADAPGGRDAGSYDDFQFRTLSAAMRSHLDLDEGVGLLVFARGETGSLASARIQRFDVLVALDGEPVRSVDDIRMLLSGVPAGAQVPLTVIRRGEEVRLYAIR